MLKKLFKSAAAFSLLLGCYFGYVRVFAIVVQQFTASNQRAEIFVPVRDSISKRMSIDIAKAAFGADDWTAEEDLGYRYYNTERGYYIYAQEAVPVVEEDGVRYDRKRIRLKPFAMIIKSQDGKNTKTITSDVAVIDLNEPLGFTPNPSGEPLKIKHALLEPNVLIRDDRNTPDDRSDDRIAGPYTHLEYDEPTQQITSDSHVIIQDPGMVTTGDGMLIQLRKDETLRLAGSSSGFDGAERMDLNKNVHVVMHDVGKSGFMPALAEPRATSGKTAEATLQSAEADSSQAKPAPPAQPTPLDLRCDSKMQVFLPKSKLPVRIGPPEPPAPTLVQFDRNVVVLRGQLDDRPDQLTCDTFKLTLVPGEKEQAKTVVQSESTSGAGRVSKSHESSEPTADPDVKQDSGLFGDLSLQRIHATGHAVWLSLPAQGVKLRCNELIHLKLAPAKPDRTYFRGDLTRPLELWKVDLVENEDDSDGGEVSSVTYIRTVDATMFDRGAGRDATDIVANGPGRLETRPGLAQPVERIAIWQDKLFLQNELGPEGQILRKQIILTGKRPCFIDQAKKSSLDSAYSIRVWLKPRPKAATVSSDEASAPQLVAGPASPGAGTALTDLTSPSPTPPATPNVKNPDVAGDRTGSDLGGGNFDVERVLALRDVHLLAPSKTMTARERLDAEFVEPEPSPTIPSSPAGIGVASNSANGAPGTTAPDLQEAKKPDPSSPKAQDQVAADGQPKPPPAEPAMVGSAERIWLKMEMKPVKGAASNTPSGNTGPNSTALTRTGSTGRAANDANAEIRNAWLWGSVSLHQDPSEGKTKGQDASGEALYVDNRGEGKVISYVYQRDPDEKTYLPGPLPPARVENDGKTIEAAGVIKMNQATDQAWVEGSGTLTQSTKRAPSPPPAGGAVDPPAVVAAPKSSKSASKGNPRPTSLVSRKDGPVKTEDLGDQDAAGSKPKTRAGKPLSEIVTTTIYFSEGMEFTGRTTDPQGNPAACADFHGVVTAEMEDALLHCEERMITYTDKVVSLAQLGAMSNPQSRSKSRVGAADDTDTEQTEPQLALIECYRNALLITREVDPDRPILRQQKRVEAQEVLFYDRRTGDFTIPRAGKILLYDRSDNSKAPASKPAGDPNSKPAVGGTGRNVTPTSGRTSDRSSRPSSSSAGKTKSKTPAARPKKSEEPKAEAIPSLVLTKIVFSKGMRSQPGTGREDDKRETHWYEFFGNVQLARAKVRDGKTDLDFDKLPEDAMFLTGQTMRFITEPPPAGSPVSTPARDYGKAWENAHFTSADKSLETDVITYESEKDLIYAYGEGGRGVGYAQQYANGQPATRGTARAIRYHPKSGSMDLLDNSSIQLVDKNTGVRPAPADAYDPDIKKKKPPKRGFRIPTNNMERRGFNGQ